MEELIRVDSKLFVGRVEEQKQFRAALGEVVDPPAGEDLPYICLLYGDGGMGKTTLVKRFRDIALKEEPFAGEFQLLWIDWEDERKKFPSLKVGRNQISEETVFKTIHVAAIREKWGRQFAAYRKALQEREDAAKKVAEVLAADNDWDELGVLRSLGVDALAKIIRLRLPMIGDAGEELVETFLDAGIEVGVEQAVKLRTAIENQLRAALKASHFDYFLNPQEQLALAVARGLNRVARRERLLVVLDSYELIDRVDIWMRVVIRSAGPRVMWIISDRHDLLHSRQFGREYFKGYADDFPRRLLAYQMRPLAIPHIRSYFEARAPERPLSGAETEAISRVTRGIPLAVQEAAEIWNAGASLSEIVGEITINTPGSQIVQKMTDRYLQHVVLEADRRALFALALADGDVDVLRAMLQPGEGSKTSVDLEELLRRLEREYASVHGARARLHDDPAIFFREYLKDPIRRSSQRVLRLTRRAVDALRARLGELEAELAHTEDRCTDDNWVQAALSLTHYLFWVDEKEAWRWLIPRFVEGLAYSRDLQNGLVEVADEWHGHLSENGERFLHVLRGADEDEENLLHVMQQLKERGWLDGEGAQEREAILRLRRAAALHRQGHWQEALALYREVETGLGEGQEMLRQELAVAYESLARRSLAEMQALTRSRRAEEAAPTAQGARAAGAAPPPGAEDESVRAARATAVELLQKVTDWFPDRQQSWYLLGSIHESAGDRQQAVVALQQAVSLADPDEPQTVVASRRLGDLYRSLGRLDEARAAYETVRTAAPKDSAAHSGLGAVYQAQGEEEAARAAYEAALESAQGSQVDPEVLVGLAQIHLRQGNDAEARNLFLRALARDPRHAAACRGLAEAAYHLGQLPAALSAYRQAIAINSHDAEAYLGLGNVYYRGMGQRRPARVAYERALTVLEGVASPEIRVQAHIGLGDIHREDNRHEAALRAYRQALAGDADAIAAYDGMARAYRAMGRYQEALEAHQQAVAAAERRAPDYDFAYDNLGDVYLALGHYGEAVGAYEQELAVRGGSAHAYGGLGDARFALGQLREAREAYRQAMAAATREDAFYAAALRGIGNVHRAEGRPAEALRAYRQAIDLDPLDAESQLCLGQALPLPQQAKEAEAALRRAIDLRPDDARPHAALGDLYRHLGRGREAGAAYDAALALDPALTAAHAGLGQLLADAGRIEEAAVRYRRALKAEGGRGVLPRELANSRARAHRGLGNVYRIQAQQLASQGEAEAAQAANRQALEAYRQATALNPHDGLAFTRVGEVRLSLGEQKAALAAFRQALAVPGLEDIICARARYGLARAYQALDQQRQALEAFQEAARLQPDWAAPRVGLGAIYVARQQPEEAVAAFEEALVLKVGPGPSPEGWFPPGSRLPAAPPIPFRDLGDQYLRLERYEAAADAYRRVLQRQPDDVAAHLGLGEAARALGEMAEAEEAYRRALEPPSPEAVAEAGGVPAEPTPALSPGERARARSGLAALLVATGRYEEAVEVYRQVIRYQETAAEAATALAPLRCGLGDALAGLRRFAEARAAYRQALEGDPEPAVAAAAYRGLARVAQAMGRHEVALEAYEKGEAVAREAGEPTRPDALLGEIYRSLGRQEEAQAAFEVTLEADERELAARLGLGALYYQQGQLQEALGHYQRAVRQRPHAAAPYVGLGRVHAALGSPDLAAVAYRHGLQASDGTDVDRAAAHAGLAELHMGQGDYRQAARAYQRAIASGGATGPGAAAALRGLGEAFLGLSAWAEAADAFEQAVVAGRGGPDTAGALLGLAQARNQLQRPAEAASSYERALALQPDNPAAHFQLGQTYATLGRHEAALRAYERAHALAAAAGAEPDAVDPLQLNLYRGRSALALGHREEARAYYEEARARASAESDPAALAPVHIFGGEVLRGLGQDAEAVEAYRQALALEPAAQAAYVGLGDAYAGLGNYEAAVSSYRRALKNGAGDRAHGGLGAAYAALGNFKAAARAYEQAVALAPAGTPQLAAYQAGLANAYVHLGRERDALVAYDRALRLDPQLLVAYEGLARLLRRQGKVERALDSYRLAAELDPQRAPVQEGLGAMLLAQGEPEEAQLAFERAIALDPQLVAAHQGLGQALETQGLQGLAVAAYEQAQALGADGGELHETLGRLYTQLGRPRQALVAYQMALERRRNGAALYAGLGAVYEALGQDEDAFAAYQQARQRDPQLAAIHYGLGNLHRRRGRAYDAVQSYRQAAELDEAYAAPHFGLAALYMEMGRSGEAVTAAQRAAELAPEWGLAHLQLARFYTALGRLQDALQAYEQALESGRLTGVEAAAAYSGRGDLLLELGEVEQARQAFKAALLQNPRDGAAVAGLGDLHAAAGNLDQALASYQEALQLDPERSRTYTSLGYLYTARGAAEEALAAFQRAITLDPRDARARSGLGDAYRLLGRTDEALAAYQRAIRLNARLAGPHMGQAQIYRALARPYDALKAYRRAAELDPQLAAAYVGMGQLYSEWGHTTEAFDNFEKARRAATEQGGGAANDLAAAELGLGNLRRDQRAYAQAIDAYERAQLAATDPELEATIWANLADIYNTLGQQERAVSAYRAAVELRPDDALSHGSLAGLYRKLGRMREYEAQITHARELMEEESEYNRACLEAIAGDADLAVDLLQVALDKRQVDLSWVRQDPDFDFIREHPRFQALLRGNRSQGPASAGAPAPAD